MRMLSFLSALLCVSAVTATAQTADLNQIDRTIAKEPAYQNKPKYCLLVFGPEARRRVWLVVDGEVLYMSRQGSGNVKEKEERGETFKQSNIHAAGDISDPDRGTKHTALTIKPEKDGGMQVSLMTEGKYRQRSGSVKFAGSPREAPILHFNGPASVRFSSAELDPERGKVEFTDCDSDRMKLLRQLNKDFPVPGERRQDRAITLGAVVGTPGLGEGTFVTYKARDILGQSNERIVVEAAFPNQDAKAKPILVKGFLQPDT